MVLILNWIVRMSKISIFKVDTETLGGNNMELDKILDYLDCRAKEVKKIDYEIGDIYKFLFSKCLTETIKKHCQIINKDIFGIETYKKYVDYESERLKGLWQVGYFLKYKGKKVPPVLLSGNHAEIKKWRAEQSKLRTSSRRPDLLR